MMPRSVRFTDATSNFGWSAAISAVIAQIADRAMVDRGKDFHHAVSYPVFPFFILACTDM